MSGAVEAMDTVPPGADAVCNSLTDPLAGFMTRNDLNKLIMNYLVVEGYQEVCETFRNESGTALTSCSESMSKRVKVREAVVGGQIEEAMLIVQQFYPRLFEDNSKLHFQMQKQHLIELIRAERIDDALTFAQIKLADLGRQDIEFLAELEQVMALLAFRDPEQSPFADLLLLSQRYKLASDLNEAMLAMENEATGSELVSLYKLIHWVQHELDQKKVKYRRMIDFSTGTFEPPSL